MNYDSRPTATTSKLALKLRGMYKGDMHVHRTVTAQSFLLVGRNCICHVFFTASVKHARTTKLKVCCCELLKSPSRAAQHDYVVLTPSYELTADFFYLLLYDSHQLQKKCTERMIKASVHPAVTKA